MTSASHLITNSSVSDFVINRRRPAKYISALVGDIDLTVEAKGGKSSQRRQAVGSYVHPNCAKLPKGLIFDIGAVIVVPFELFPGIVEPLPNETFTGFGKYDVS